MYSIGFLPLIPTPWLWALTVLAALALVPAVVMRGKGAIGRALALATIVLALWNPSLNEEQRDPVGGIVAIVIDRTASQSLGDRPGMTDTVRVELEKKIKEFGGIETRFIDVSDSAGDEGTLLFTALANGLADIPPHRLAGVIAVTDGVTHDLPGAVKALGVSAPLHVLVTGRPDERDRQIHLIAAPRFVLVGKDQMVRAEIRERNGTGSAILSVRRDGETILRRAVPTNTPFSVDIRVEHAGPNLVELEVEALVGELTLANNLAVIPVEGVREKLRVLLVSGAPHPGERTWRNLLKSDPSVDLVHFTILRPPTKLDTTPVNELSLIAFPTRELFQEKIKDFDLIIFDRYDDQSILPPPYFDNIVRYVREGGAVLTAAGPEFSGPASLAATGLAEIIPGVPDGTVIETPFKATLTERGRRHPVTRGLPGSETTPPAWGEWLRIVSAKVPPNTTLLSGAQDKPLLMLQQVEKGRVALFLSDHPWLWARGYRGGGPHQDLLRRVSHWLMKEPALEEEAVRATATGRTIRIERQSMSDEPPVTIITAPSGVTTALQLARRQPGLFVVEFQAGENGLHKVQSGPLTAFTSIGPANPRELIDVFSDTEAMRGLAEATGGSIRRLAGPGDRAANVPAIRMVASGVRASGSDWIGLRRTEVTSLRGVRFFPLGLGLFAAALLLAFAAFAWMQEGWRRNG